MARLGRKTEDPCHGGVCGGMTGDSNGIKGIDWVVCKRGYFRRATAERVEANSIRVREARRLEQWKDVV